MLDSNHLDNQNYTKKDFEMELSSFKHIKMVRVSAQINEILKYK